MLCVEWSRFCPLFRSISPSLPVGLALDASDGVISGTPSEVTLETVYTVTATNLAGSDTVTVAITVVPLPPVLGGSYSEDPATYMDTIALETDNSVSVTGVVESWCVKSVDRLCQCLCVGGIGMSVLVLVW